MVQSELLQKMQQLKLRKAVNKKAQNLVCAWGGRLAHERTTIDMGTITRAVRNAIAGVGVIIIAIGESTLSQNQSVFLLVCRASFEREFY